MIVHHLESGLQMQARLVLSILLFLLHVGIFLPGFSHMWKYKYLEPQSFVANSFSFDHWLEIFDSEV